MRKENPSSQPRPSAFDDESCAFARPLVDYTSLMFACFRRSAEVTPLASFVEFCDGELGHLTTEDGELVRANHIVIIFSRTHTKQKEN